MSLPAIAAYALPGRNDLPPNSASWKLDSGRAALLVHDMQEYFVRAFVDAPIDEIIDNIARLLTSCRAARIPVIYSVQPPRQSAAERGLLMDFWGAGLGVGENDQEIVRRLRPQDGDHVVTKHRYSAFHRTDLAATLRRVRRDQLVITGVYAHLGCLLTAADAFMADIQPFLVADAVADFDAEHHELALRYAAERCAVLTLSDDVAGTFGR
ncbi:MAG: isochorismatase family protein [Nonomuraea sp.]|nr:isochorismatase family protein [Nonomuraea sp.]